MGNAFVQRHEISIYWGVPELTFEVGVGIEWQSHRQDMGHDPGVAPTAGINKDGSSWVALASFKRNFGGSISKNLPGV
jgi:hypothetical protein